MAGASASAAFGLCIDQVRPLEGGTARPADQQPLGAAWDLGQPAHPVTTQKAKPNARFETVTLGESGPVLVWQGRNGTAFPVHVIAGHQRRMQLRGS